jgi:hypothetical protein
MISSPHFTLLAQASGVAFRPRSPDATLTKRLGSLKSIRTQNMELIFRDKATVSLFDESEDFRPHTFCPNSVVGDA